MFNDSVHASGHCIAEWQAIWVSYPTCEYRFASINLIRVLVMADPDGQEDYPMF
jgi:hypothetical protein